MSRRTRAGVWLAAALLPVAATPFVLTSITVDGNMADWAAVLADANQASHDGPFGGTVDRDAPVQSTGRDLTTFAWTYDATSFYMYIERVGSSSNRQHYWFYLDANEDGTLASGEPVFHVGWQGNTRSTECELYRYNAVASSGDPLGGATGLADGWDMPGSITLQAATDNLNGGSADGLKMESRVTWAALGLPAGTPFRFHVASSNSVNLPNQIDDNMGGPGGAVGSTRISGAVLAPDRTTTVVPAGNAILAHTLRNTGANSDRFELTWSSSGGFTPSGVVFYRDVDANGLLGPGDALLTDTNGGGVPDTGPLAAGASLALLAAIAAPGGASSGQVATVVLRATSAAQPTMFDPATDVVTVASPAITLLKAVNPATAPPGTVLTYTITYTNTGATTAYNVVVVDAVPADTVYRSGSAAGTGMTIEFSHDGGTSFNGSSAAPVTHVRWTRGATLAVGGSGSVTFQVTIS